MPKIPSIQQTQLKSLKLTPTPFHLSMTNDLSVQVLGTSASCNRRKKKTFLNTSLIVNCDKTEDIKSSNNRGFPTFYMYTVHVFQVVRHNQNNFRLDQGVSSSPRCLRVTHCVLFLVTLNQISKTKFKPQIFVANKKVQVCKMQYCNLQSTFVKRCCERLILCILAF